MGRDWKTKRLLQQIDREQNDLEVSEAKYIEWYGGSTGATAAQNTTAFNALNAAIGSNGGTVYLSAGTYSINAVTLTNPIRICGTAGDYDSTILSYSGSGIGITIQGTRSELHNLTIEGDTQQGTGVRIDGVRECLINRCKFNDLDVGLSIHTDTDKDNAHFNDINSCWFNANDTGLLIHTTAGDTPHNNRITNCRFQSNDEYGAKLEAGSEQRFISCDFAGTGLGGTDLYINTNHTLIFGTTFESGDSTYNIDIQSGVTHTRIYGVNSEGGKINGLSNDDYHIVESNPSAIGFTLGVSKNIYASGSYQKTGALATTASYLSKVTGDSYWRWLNLTNGLMAWGDGTNSTYTNMMQLLPITETIDLSTPAQKHTIYTVPSGSKFFPIMTQFRADTDITATNGDFLGIGVDAANRRMDYFPGAAAAAAGKFPKNTKKVFLGGSSTAVQNATDGDVICLMAIDSSTDAANLSGNDIGGSGESATVIILGWLVNLLEDAD